MCLFVTPDAKVSVAESDIEVFKVLLQIQPTHPDYSGFGYGEKMFSPYRSFVYEVGNTYSANFADTPVQACKVVEDWPEWNSAANVDRVPRILADFVPDMIVDETIGAIENGIHTFDSLDGVDAIMENLGSINSPYWKPVVARCIIRKGTPYYSGAWIFHNPVWDSVVKRRMKSYASTSLEIIEVLK